MKSRLFILGSFFALAALTTCNSDRTTPATNSSDSAVAVIPEPAAQDTISNIEDTATIPGNSEDTVVRHFHKFTRGDSIKIIPSPAPVEIDTPQMGLALVYCPNKMIKNSQNIITARITKNELEKAVTDLVAAISKQENKKADYVKNNLYQKQLQVYNKMEVQLQCDEEIFKVTAAGNDSIQSFAPGDTELEWNWELKPTAVTSQTVLSFIFKGIDQNNRPIKLGERMLYVTVQVDVRSFWSKWMEFLSDDPKYTITAIIVPLITFLGGYFLKRKAS